MNYPPQLPSAHAALRQRKPRPSLLSTCAAGCLMAACCAVEDLGLNSEATSLPSSQLCQTLHINKAWEPVRALAGRGGDLLAGGENGWHRGEFRWQNGWQGRRLAGRGGDLLAGGEKGGGDSAAQASCRWQFCQRSKASPLMHSLSLRLSCAPGVIPAPLTEPVRMLLLAADAVVSTDRHCAVRSARHCQDAAVQQVRPDACGKPLELGGSTMCGV